eukprot:GHVP01049062.1.p1 GENE.GHVP01049062.1~~GHVP01049062.1.p1  ORF type:complete len:356 (+),score=41.19 GHVP01049062.1:888-1955(+)
MLTHQILMLIPLPINAFRRLPLICVDKHFDPLTYTEEDIYGGPLYQGHIKVGNSELLTIFDTTSPSIFVLSNKCLSGLCIDSSAVKYEPSINSTPHGYHFILNKERNKMKGIISRDTIIINGVKILKQTFVEITKLYGPSFKKHKFDCLFGFQIKNPISKTTSPFENIISDKKLNRNVIGIWYNPKKGFGIDGEITFGGIDCNKIIEHPIFVPIRNNGIWNTTITSIEYGNDKIIISNRICSISTKDFFISVPYEDAFLIHNKLGFIKKNNMNTIKCNEVGNLKALNIIVCGKVLSIPPDKYTFRWNDLCYSAIMPQSRKHGVEMSWKLGATFLKTYYTILDYDTNQIGFARMAL